MSPIHRWYIVALCTCAVASSRAGDPPVPPIVAQGTATKSGGTGGGDAANPFGAEASEYNLRITFASAESEGYPGVKVTLRDAHGEKVIETTSDGPFVFFKMRAGRYQVTAENLGQSITSFVHVREERATEVHIRWKALSGSKTQ